ncbi:uncharacterized protein CTRU02_205474 [Colletotrichum truncatum]|uniref:Uncharacterized protein n=1 Tax=Colletotrichum truncatum TaxID=5467 RepID=A0ACC3Z445_COLTU|nr:uncharacterized protein CTRU02_04530 [Colletotrichum truncatum]KAF6795720.1 hypothetical protein CTRU02_04530 [Colletotrichum truncatum]
MGKGAYRRIGPQLDGSRSAFLQESGPSFVRLARLCLTKTFGVEQA